MRGHVLDVRADLLGVVPPKHHGELGVEQVVGLWRTEKIDIGCGHERPPWLGEVGHRGRRERTREGLHGDVRFLGPHCSPGWRVSSISGELVNRPYDTANRAM